MRLLADAMEEARTGAARRARVQSLVALLSAARNAPPARGFAAALRSASPRLGAAPDGLPAVIAEIKFVSPSQGVLRRRRDVEIVARAYAAAGAAALSVLVDAPRFAGHPDHLARARAACTLPLLAKGFFADPYQLAEMRLAGADAVLLIAAALDRAALRELVAAAAELGLDALVELHGPDDLAHIDGLPLALVGVNHRDLHTLRLDRDASARLAPRLPAGATRVAESGLATRGDLARMAALGFDAVLVGTALMRAHDPGAALAALRERTRGAKAKEAGDGTG